MYCLMQKYTRGYILPKNRMQNYTRGIILWVGIFLPVTPGMPLDPPMQLFRPWLPS